MADWSKLSEELKKLGVQHGAEQLSPPRKKDSKPIESLVHGRDIQTVYGNVFSVNRSFTSDYHHGEIPIQPFSDKNVLCQWAGAPILADRDISSFVFLDTETTGLSGGTGTIAFMIGAARVVGSQLQVEQFFLRNPAEEKAQLSALASFVEGASAIVSYNGKSFDLPIINTRYVLNRIKNPFLDFEHFDLLHIARRVWRRRLKQCNLGKIEKEILGFFRSGVDIPGYLVPEFYRDYLLKGDASQIPGIFYHNENDVLSLLALFNVLADILENPSIEHLPHAQDRLSVGLLMEDLQKNHIVEQMYANDPDEFTNMEEKILTLMLQANLHKRNRDFNKAIPIWEEALELGSFRAGIQLAMFYEHQLNKISQAIYFTQESKRLIDSTEKTHLKEKLLCEINHRLNRLFSKLPGGKDSGTSH
jgi:uncharacterized protein YprB with RNaseH-like and TPR domain